MIRECEKQKVDATSKTKKDLGSSDIEDILTFLKQISNQEEAF